MHDVEFRGYTERKFWENALIAELRSGASGLFAISSADSALEAWRIRSVGLTGD